MQDIYNIVKDKFNLEIPIFIISALELEDILNNNPKCGEQIIKKYMII